VEAIEKRLDDLYLMMQRMMMVMVLKQDEGEDLWTLISRLQIARDSG